MAATKEVDGVIRPIQHAAEENAVASKEQSAASEEINRAVDNLSSITVLIDELDEIIHGMATAQNAE